MPTIPDLGAHVPPVIGTQLDHLAERCRELTAERNALAEHARRLLAFAEGELRLREWLFTPHELESIRVLRSILGGSHA